jgi:hypothetical protein
MTACHSFGLSLFISTINLVVEILFILPTIEGGDGSFSL